MRFGDGPESSNFEDRTGGGGGLNLGGGLGHAPAADCIPFRHCRDHHSCAGLLRADPVWRRRDARRWRRRRGGKSTLPEEQRRFLTQVLGNRPSRSGVRSSPRPARNIGRPRWSPTPIITSRAAAPRRRQWAPSTARATRRSTSTRSFFEELSRRFGAPGDFAQAYVIAHEVGHHIQNLEGTLDKAQARAGAASDRRKATRCRSGSSSRPTAMPAYGRARPVRSEQGDIEEGMRAAEAIGDDMLTQGKVSPDNFTHGTSAQRMEALRRGLSTGNPSSCNYAR